MIKRLAAMQFKSIRDTGMTLGRCTLLIGPNGGGKSNILDAIRFLQGVGNGFTVREILEGTPPGAAYRSWAGLRGGAAEALWRGNDPADTGDSWLQSLRQDSFAIYAALAEAEQDGYAIAVHPERALVVHEQLQWHGKGFVTLGDGIPHDLIPARLWPGQKGQPPQWPFPAATPVLTGMVAAPPATGRFGDLSATCRAVAAQFADIQFLDLDLKCLRSYAQRDRPTMGEHGEHFAAIAQRLAEEGVLQPWLSQLLRDGIRAIRPFGTEFGELMFGIEDTTGAHISARSLSDGTLRFAALTTALLAPKRPEVLLIEEIENGLHPARLGLVVEMLLAATEERGQVIATTHSPAVLAHWPRERHTDILVVTRAEDGGGTEIVPLPEMPGYEEAMAHQHLDALHIEGWTATPV